MLDELPVLRRWVLWQNGFRMQPLKIYLDGQFLDEPDAKISVFDHGLLYGDGVFEGIRFYNGRVFLLEDHLDRLYDSAKAILLTVPLERDAMREIVLETCRQNSLRDGYIRLVITRGKGDLGLNPNKCASRRSFASRRRSSSTPRSITPRACG